MRILWGMAVQAKGILPSVQGLELKIRHSSFAYTAPHLETLVCALRGGVFLACLELQVTPAPLQEEWLCAEPVSSARNTRSPLFKPYGCFSYSYSFS